MEDPEIPETLQTLAFLTVLGAFIILILLFVALVIRQLREKILTWLGEFYNKLVFNGLIRMNSLQYIKWSVFLAGNVNYIIGNTIPLEGWMSWKVVLVSIYVFAMPLITAIFLLCNFSNLENKEFTSKYQNMYSNIGFKKGKAAVLYYPLFLLKRLLMIAITVVFLEREGLQLQFLCLLTIAYVISY